MEYFNEIFELLRNKKRTQYVILNPDIKYTKYLFGDISELKGSLLQVVDTSVEGDCLCSVNSGHLVDVDHRDIYRLV